MREGQAAMDRVGVHVSTAKLSRLIRHYLRTGCADVPFPAWLLTYADPTGEAAVRNVMRSH